MVTFLRFIYSVGNSSSVKHRKIVRHCPTTTTALHRSIRALQRRSHNPVRFHQR